MTMLFSALRSHNTDVCALSEPGRVVSYGMLPALIDARAEKIQQSGARTLALSMDNGVEWVLWDLAALKTGVALVPLPPFFTPAQIRHALTMSGCGGMITGDGIMPVESQGNQSLPAGTAKVTFTSGTTGTPKGVCLSAHAMMSVAESIVNVLGRDMAGRHLSVLPLAVLLENVAGVYATLWAGGTVYLSPLSTFGINYARIAETIIDVQASSAILVPEILRTLTAQIKTSGVVPSLKFLAVGGSKVSPDLIHGARDAGLPVYEGYGLSECASVVSLNVPGADQPGTVGRPLPHLRVEIVQGEILVHNAGFLGYVGETHVGPVMTGDLGKLDENGFLSVTGRKKNILITSYGRNISPEWVESELLSYPGIGQAVVYGDGAPALGALISPVSAEADIPATIRQVNERLPDYARICHFSIVPPFTVQDNTLTGTGRPRREHILNLYAQEKRHDIL